MMFQYVVPALVILAIAALAVWRWSDARADARLAQWLVAKQPRAPDSFSPDMVADLPMPARRYFTYAITPGTPLYTVAEIEMTGELGMGTKEKPGYNPMTARQILAAPHGFIWKVETGSRLMRISGSDAAGGGDSWSRFRVVGLMPVARGGHTRDHERSSFGRLLAEAAFWSPAALLPREGVTWESVDDRTARARVFLGGVEQTVDVTVDDAGRPVRVSLPRWTNANRERVFRIQPFGGEMSEFRDFAGFRLPTRVDGGNFFGTDDYFPFYRAEVRSVRFPAAPAEQARTP